MGWEKTIQEDVCAIPIWIETKVQNIILKNVHTYLRNHLAGTGLHLIQLLIQQFKDYIRTIIITTIKEFEVC